MLLPLFIFVFMSTNNNQQTLSSHWLQNETKNCTSSSRAHMSTCRVKITQAMIKRHATNYGFRSVVKHWEQQSLKFFFSFFCFCLTMWSFNIKLLPFIRCDCSPGKNNIKMWRRITRNKDKMETKRNEGRIWFSKIEQIIML